MEALSLFVPAYGEVNLVFNEGGIEVFYDRGGNAVTIPTRTVFDFPSDSIPNTPTLKRIKSYSETITDSVKKVAFIRRGAMGDILMLLPVVREFRKKHPNLSVSLITNLDPIGGIKIIEELNDGVFDEFLSDVRINTNGYDVAFHLDGLLERDHYIPKYFDMHRVDIYREFFGFPQGEEPEWSTDIPEVGTKGIVFCWQGSSKTKTLAVETKEYVVERIKTFAQPVFLVDELRELGPEALIEACRKAVALITMDSGPLWIAHHTRTPVVLLHGPSRAKERLGYHPLRPEGVADIDLAEMIGCKVCFEHMVACQDKASCMRAPKERVWSEIQNAVRKVRWKTR